MPLSEHEQKILDEIERRLAEEDPGFARATAVATPDEGDARKRLRRGIVGFSLGVVLLIVGLITSLGNANLLFVFGLAAFGVMLWSVLGIVRAARVIGPRQRTPRDGWLKSMEKRWRERFDDDAGDGS